jgi:hypothetical protein
LIRYLSPFVHSARRKMISGPVFFDFIADIILWVISAVRANVSFSPNTQFLSTLAPALCRYRLCHH